jgi:hypothetical protein
MGWPWGGLSKHAIKQVDRLLSNPGIDTKELLSRWVPYIVGSRENIEVAMDWTDFDADNQATIMLCLITSHGRATPLVWLSVGKDTLKDSPEPLRISGVDLACRSPSGRRQSLDCGRPGIWRSQALPGADRRAEIRLSHSFPREYPRSQLQMAKPERRSTGLASADERAFYVAPR